MLRRQLRKTTEKEETELGHNIAPESKKRSISIARHARCAIPPTPPRRRVPYQHARCRRQAQVLPRRPFSPRSWPSAHHSHPIPRRFAHEQQLIGIAAVRCRHRLAPTRAARPRQDAASRHADHTRANLAVRTRTWAPPRLAGHPHLRPCPIRAE